MASPPSKESRPQTAAAAGETERYRTLLEINNTLIANLTRDALFRAIAEAVRRVVPGHVPYAEKFGVWQRGLGPMKVALEEIWKPYLDGHGNRDEAFAELIRRTAIEAPRK